MENNKNFIEEIIDESGNINNLKFRFPPEPNSGSLHLGHAKSICLNFNLAKKYSGTCNLRFDDTNPLKEKEEYKEMIRKDIEWLGFTPDNIFNASDYKDFFIEKAKLLINKGLAYVDDSTSEEIAEMKGTPTKVGIDSEYKSRTVEENIRLFELMEKGELLNSVLRLNIDMTHDNMLMRDPIAFRMVENELFPMYDFAHPLSDYKEDISYSICSLEFEVHRPLYEWVLNNTNLTNPLPRQIEFARLNMTNSVMSKRKVNDLIEKNMLDGIDDPRLTTISGMRRRGYTAESIRNFCDKIGVAKRNSLIDHKLLTSCVREDLNKKAFRIMSVLDPLKVTITNLEEGETIWLDAKNNPELEEMGTRKVPFTRNLYIEKEDFMENASKKFYRLSNDKEVRFKYAYYITCNEVVKDENNEIIELKCTYDPSTKGGWSDDGRKIKGTLHWVSADHCIEKEVKLYSELFINEEVKDYIKDFNHNSVETVKAYIEPEINNLGVINLQFERIGYFIKDISNNYINRTCLLRDKKK